MRKIFVYENDGRCPVEDFFQKANKKVRDKFKYQLDYIKDERNVFAAPHVKHFSIEKYRELYELRIKAADLMVRVLFYEDDNEIILLYPFYKKDHKDTDRALETGLKLLHSILNEGTINKKYRKEMIC